MLMMIMMMLIVIMVPNYPIYWVWKSRFPTSGKLNPHADADADADADAMFWGWERAKICAGKLHTVFFSFAQSHICCGRQVNIGQKIEDRKYTLWDEIARGWAWERPLELKIWAHVVNASSPPPKKKIKPQNIRCTNKDINNFLHSAFESKLGM